MALTLNLTNFSPNNIVERAHVATDASKGFPSFKIDNPQNIIANDYLLIGRPGGSASAIYQVLSVADDLVTLTANLTFYAERGTEVTKLFGNKLKVYSAPYAAGQPPLDANFSLLATGTVSIDPDQSTTAYTDPNGSADFWYKYTFYNQTTQGETTLASSDAVRDTSATDYASIDEVRKEAGFNGVQGVTDELIYRKLQAAQAKINGMLSGRYELPLTKPTNPIIADLTVRLAAGYAMIAEYGAYDGQDKTKGEKLRDDAIAELKDYQSGAQVITDLTAVSVELPDAGGFESSFGQQTAPAMFTTDDIVGYQTRIY